MLTLTDQNQSSNFMPQGTWALFFIQIVSTLSFSVLYSTLVLYLTGRLGMQVTLANSITGVFIAFNFALHLLGGFLGGRFVSNRALFCVGMTIQTIGCILLSFGSLPFLYYGLAAFLTGCGLNVTCVNCMLTQLFTPEDHRRETAFLWNYAGMNIGFFIGFSLSGIFQITQNYQQLFLLSSLGNLIALLICLLFWQQLTDKQTTFSKKNKPLQSRGTLISVGCILLLPFLLSQLLQYADWANKLVLITGAAMLVFIVYLARKQSDVDSKNKILAFTLLIMMGTVFWMLYQIGPMGLTHFIDHNVKRDYFHWVIPPQWFQNVNTITIVLGGPLLGIALNQMRQKGVQINIPAQFCLALLLIGLAFVLLPMGIACADSEGLVNPGWIIISYILQSMGELLISPIGYAMIGFLAPNSLQGIMMGIWMLNTGVGAILSSYCSNKMIIHSDIVTPALTNKNYSHVFLILGLIAISSAIVFAYLIPLLRKLMNNESLKDDAKNCDYRTEQVV